MRNITSKRRKLEREVQRLKSLRPYVCEVCGKYLEVGTAMHLLPRSLYPEYYTAEWNIIRGCLDCHKKYDDNITFRQQQTKLFEIVNKHDKQAANKYFRL